MKRLLLLPLLAATLLVAACGSTTTEREKLPPLTTVSQVDIERYMGKWYEIAMYPNSFQEGCTGTTATYSLRDDGDVKVVNRCFEGSLNGPLSEAHGRAYVADTETNAKLRVTFFWPFFGDYWVIDLADDYSYAVVGHPGRDYLWILSRTPQMDDSVYQGIIERLEAKHYDPSRLVKTQQPTS